MKKLRRRLSKVWERIWGDDEDPANEKRRTVLKMIGFGAGAFAVFKAIDYLGGFVSDNMILGERLFENFRVVETGAELRFYDRQSNEEILVIDKR